VRLEYRTFQEVDAGRCWYPTTRRIVIKFPWHVHHHPDEQCLTVFATPGYLYIAHGTSLFPTTGSSRGLIIATGKHGLDGFA
jgi:hypothetical protein